MFLEISGLILFAQACHVVAKVYSVYKRGENGDPPKRVLEQAECGQEQKGRTTKED